MARREWAQKIIAKYERKDDWGIECVSSTEVQRLLLKEHARAVRVVKARDKWLLDGGYDNMGPDFQAGYHQACNDLLAALTKGRT